MLIKSKSHTQKKSRNYLSFKAIFVVFFIIGIYIGVQGDMLKRAHKPIQEMLVKNYLTHILGKDIPKINVEINFKNKQKLEYKRNQVMAFVKHSKDDMCLMTSDQDYIPAQISLKGDGIDHIAVSAMVV